MARDIIKTVEVPEGVKASIDGSIITVKGPKGELKREFKYPNISITRKGNSLVFSTKNTTKREKAVVGSFEAHLNNMLKGVTEGFKYSMKAVYSHFPITLKLVGDTVEIHNFLGEKAPRKAKVFGDTKIDIKKDNVTITGINKDEVGQTTANIEDATRVRKRDTRVFQDGVYVVDKTTEMKQDE